MNLQLNINDSIPLESRPPVLAGDVLAADHSSGGGPATLAGGETDNLHPTTSRSPGVYTCP